MYSWIWRHIPFKQWPLKAAVSAVLVAAVGALLWYQIFPAVEPLLPFDDVRVETNDPGADTTVESPAARPSTSIPAASAHPTTPPKQVLPS
ncbi:hypothetical protein AB0M46_13140 [Dactylosporangium sp. NPDC051485]|uniref:hypothetical protein n=1 Tax=Dactylosporangium sp. NPDC051485 TaxID=3154846 RepID=UPI0034147B79